MYHVFCLSSTLSFMKWGSVIVLITNPRDLRAFVNELRKWKWSVMTGVNTLFNGLLNPKQLEGLRLLVTPFSQQQFNQTEDRRTERASRGVTCFDCHANGGSIVQEHRHASLIDPLRRNLNIARPCR